jgi:hypothetical protein
MTGDKFQSERLARETDERDRIAAAESIIYIEWHQCDLSFDFACKCGARPCGGGTYCTYIKCPKCGRIYGLPLEIKLKEIVGQPPYGIEPVTMEDMED